VKRVAAFCTKCGVELSPDKRFCAACGAPVQPPGIPSSAATAAAYAHPAPAYGQPTASGNSAVKIILIVVGALLGLGLLAIALFTFAFWRGSRTIRHSDDGVSLSTPGGTVTIGPNSAVTAADLGVPIYPGALHGEGGMRIRSAKGEVISAVYSTPDPPGKVVDFYKSSLPGDASVRLSGQRALMTAGDKEKETWMISVNTDPADSSKTKITITHVKKF
jgi:hypothetical protein